MKRVSWMLTLMVLLSLLCGVALATGDTLTPPTVTIPVDTFYPGMYVEATADAGWDALTTKIKKPNSEEYEGPSQSADNRYVAISFDDNAVPGEYELLLKGRKGETESAWSEPITLKVESVPSKTDVTVQGPEKINEGENAVFVVFLPEDGDISRIECQMSNGYTLIGSEIKSNYVVFRMDAARAAQYGTAPGEYTLSFYVQNSSYETVQEKKVSLIIEGDSFTAPNISTENVVVNKGESISLEGIAGSADALHLEVNVSRNGNAEYAMTRMEVWITPEDGKWNYTVENAESGYYSFTVTGHTSTGLCTGEEYLAVIVEEIDETALAAPSISLEDGQEVIREDQMFKIICENTNEGGPYWRLFAYDASGKMVKAESAYSDGNQWEQYLTFSKAGDYTLKAIYQKNGNWSKAGTMSLIVDAWPEIELEKVPEKLFIRGRVEVTAVEMTGLQGYSFSISEKPNSGLEIFYGYSDTPSIRTLNGWNYNAEIEPGTYYLRVNGSDGYGLAARSKAIPVVLEEGTPAAAPKLSWNVDTNTVKEYTALSVVLDREDYEAVGLAWYKEGEEEIPATVYDGENLKNLGREIPLGLEVGTWIVKGRYLDEKGIWSEWAELKMTVEELPKLDDKINLTLPDTWPAYTDYAFTWVQSDAKEKINVSLNDYSWDSENGGEQSINAESLDPGTYTVHVNAEAEGYAYWYTSKEITVTENNDRPEPPKVTLPFDTFYLGTETFEAPVDAGWSYLSSRITNADGEVKDVTGGTTGVNHMYINLRSCDAAGDYSIIFKGKKGDVWSDWSEPTTIHIAEVPTVDKITIEGPDTFALGEDVAYSIVVPENPDNGYLYFSIASPNPTSDFGFWVNERNYGIARIDASTLINDGIYPREYFFQAWVMDSTGSVVVTGASRKSITITGNSFEKLTITTDAALYEAGDTITVGGKAGSADSIYLEYQISQNGEYDEWRSVWLTPEDGNWSYSQKITAGGTVEYTAYGYTKDNLCTGKESIRVLVNDEAASLAAPTLSTSKDDFFADETVELYAQPGEVSGGLNWRALIQDESGKIMRSVDLWQSDEKYMSTFSLSDEGEYTILVTYQYENTWSKVATKKINVVPPKEIEITSSPEAVYFQNDQYGFHSQGFDVSISPLSEAEYYVVTIKTSDTQDDEESWVFRSYGMNPVEGIMSGLGGEWQNGSDTKAGDYYLQVIAYGQYGRVVGKSATIPISLIERIVPPAPVLSLAEGTGTIKEGNLFTIQLNSTGYDSVEVECYLGGEKKYTRTYYLAGSTDTFSQGLSAGEWTIRARGMSSDSAYISNVYSDWSDMLAVTVKAAMRLFPPQNIQIPKSVKAYEQFDFSFDPVEGAEYYEINMGGIGYWFNDYGEMRLDKNTTSGKFTGWSDSAIFESGIYTLQFAAYATDEDGELVIGYTYPPLYIRVEAADNPGGTIRLPAGLKTLEANALEGVRAAHIIVPDGCVKIEGYAFANNANLSLISIPATVTELDPNAFEGVPMDVVIVTPYDSAAEELAKQKGLTVWVNQD